MPKHIPALATRAAVVVTTTAAAAAVALLPASTPAATIAPAAVSAPAPVTRLLSPALRGPLGRVAPVAMLSPVAAAPAAPAPAAVPAPVVVRTPAVVVVPAAVVRTPAAATPPAAVPAPAAARTTAAVTAMELALTKIGSPYRWGATGPSAFDCSGLVTWAFKNAGISLPRTSRAMSTVGTQVSRADLRPGDLVFFYKPVSHVGIYIGDGKIVHASSSGKPVKISDMSGKTFNSARRL